MSQSRPELMNSLGAKKDIYTSSRCMSSGILLGRMAAGVAGFRRALENKEKWSPAYGVGRAAHPAAGAARDIERFLPTARSEARSFADLLEPYYRDISRFGFNYEGAVKDVATAEGHLSKIAQIAVKNCGKRRPEEGEGDALLRMKHVKRASRPKPARVQEMVLPVIEEPEKREESGTPWGLIASVALIIGAAFLVR